MINYPWRAGCRLLQAKHLYSKNSQGITDERLTVGVSSLRGARGVTREDGRDLSVGIHHRCFFRETIVSVVLGGEGGELGD